MQDIISMILFIKTTSASKNMSKQAGTTNLLRDPEVTADT